MKDDFKLVLGLEVHIELATKTKMFCGCLAHHFGEQANTHVCPTCMGLPGALPFANKEAIDFAVKFGSSFNSRIAEYSKFDRKHYFYPDLPKAYQISQYDLPFCSKGTYELNSGKIIHIRRIHLEEDTGKLIHKKVDGKNTSLIDYNRSGVPLMEMVTEPDFEKIEEAVEFLKEVQHIARYLSISDADMEKGSMRLEANLSLSQKDTKGNYSLPDYKIELKNINSFKFMQKAIEAEIIRQKRLLLEGKTPAQETRGFDEAKGTTFSQRSKEEAKDYRYFPEPDLPPIRFTKSEISKVMNHLVELPREKVKRFKKEYSLSDHYLLFLVADRGIADYFEEAVKVGKDHLISPKEIANVMVNMKMHEEHELPAELIKKLVAAKKTSFASDDDTKKAVVEVISQNSRAVKDYKEGKVQIIGFLIGQVQKILQGKGDPKIIQNILRENLFN